MACKDRRCIALIWVEQWGESMVEFDDERLSELLDVFGVEDLKLIVDAFFEEAGQALAGLSDLIGPEPDPIREGQLHYLVGAARNLGAVAFGELCKEYQLSDGFSASDHARLRETFRNTCDDFTARMLAKATDAA